MTPRAAIVGSGLGGFVAYTTLRHTGFGGPALEPGEIVVFGDDPDPAGAWRPRAAAIRQKRMRSESDGHCYPTSFPGLASREAARRRDLAPLAAERLQPLPADRRRVPPARRRVAREHGLGRELPPRRAWSACAPSTAASSSTASASSGTFSSLPATRASRRRRSWKATRAPSTPTSRTSTPRGSPWSARGWLRRPSG